MVSYLFAFSFSVVVLLCTNVSVNSLEVAFIPVPHQGHFNMMSTIAQELNSRGHNIKVYVAEFFMSSCQTTLKNLCVSLGSIDGTNVKAKVQHFYNMESYRSFACVRHADKSFNGAVAMALKEKIQKTNARPDIMFIDIGVWGVDNVAKMFKIPCVIFLPSPLSLPIQMNPSIPALGSGLSIEMNVFNRLKNYMFQRLHYWSTSIRKTEIDGFNQYSESYINLFFKRHIITPAIYGLDAAQPICPNVHSVGFLFSHQNFDSSIDSVLKSWMNECKNGIVYFNVASAADSPNEFQILFTNSIKDIMKKSQLCVLQAVHKGKNQELKRFEERFKGWTFFPGMTNFVLQHAQTRALVSDCESIDVYESVARGVPIIGLPSEADQLDMCARVADAKVGFAFDSLYFNSSELSRAVLHLAEDAEVRSRIETIKNMGNALGGAKKASDVIQFVASMGRNDDAFFCRSIQLPFLQRYDLDVTLILSCLIALFVVVLRKIPLCRKRKRSLDGKRKKQD